LSRPLRYDCTSSRRDLRGRLRLHEECETDAVEHRTNRQLGKSDVDDYTVREIHNLDADIRFKPISIAQIHEAVRRLLSKRRRSEGAEPAPDAVPGNGPAHERDITRAPGASPQLASESDVR
jgi:hypothetical protein